LADATVNHARIVFSTEVVYADCTDDNHATLALGRRHGFKRIDDSPILDTIERFLVEAGGGTRRQVLLALDPESRSAD
jgi:hypothetical protein